MTSCRVSYREWNVTGKPLSSDVSLHVSGPCKLMCGRNVVAVVQSYTGDLSRLRKAAESVRYPTNATRTNGLPVKNRSFGFTTRNVIRGDYCSAAGLSREDTASHATLCDFSTELVDLYRRCLPERCEEHEQRAAKRIADEWKLADQRIFTSGNANRNNAIAYHYDTGNIPGCFSAMIVLRKGCQGGELILPEYDVGIYLRDGDVLFFDGQGILHGVTQLELESDDSYRISLVYYTLDQMWKCLTGDDEIQRIRTEKTSRERAIKGRAGYRGGKPEFRKRRDLPS